MDQIARDLESPVTPLSSAVGDASLETEPWLISFAREVRASNARKQPPISDRERTALLLSGDFIAACAALPLALLLLAAFSHVQANSLGAFTRNLADDALFPVAVILALTIGGNYRLNHRPLQPNAFNEAKDLIFSIGAGCVLVLAVMALLHAEAGFNSPHPTQLVVAVGVAFVVISATRIAMRALLGKLKATRVLVVGSGPLADRLMTYVGLDPAMECVGRVGFLRLEGSGQPGSFNELPKLIRTLGVQRIIVASDEVTPDSVEIYRSLQDWVHIAFVPKYFELVSWRSRLTDLFGLPLVDTAPCYMNAWDRAAKRAFDIVVSILALVFLAPLVAVLAIAVKRSSPGPVFFRQTRLGRHRKPFTIYKFRTMRGFSSDDIATTCISGMATSGITQLKPLHELRGKSNERDRVTRIGRFMRKTGLDEIPQFTNVLRGEMSVVGPRPFLAHESNDGGWAARRYEVRPGITGLWQVSGRNELSEDDLRQLDYLYVASWSLWWDLKIVFDTPRAMVRGLGAY